MRKFFIILIQAIVFLAGLALLFVGHPLAFLASFIMVFSAYDSYMWFYVFKDIYAIDKNNWTVSIYRGSQWNIQLLYFYFGVQYYGWFVAGSTVVVWWLGFADLCYYWLNLLKVDEYLDWMCNWSVHWLIKFIKESNLLFNPIVGDFCDKNVYNCPRSWFLWFAWVGLTLSIIINILGIII